MFTFPGGIVSLYLHIFPYFIHCLKNNLTLCIKTELFTVGVGAYATLYVWFLGQTNVYNSRRYSVASTPAVTFLVFCRGFLLFLGQCIAKDTPGGYREGPLVNINETEEELQWQHPPCTLQAGIIKGQSPNI